MARFPSDINEKLGSMLSFPGFRKVVLLFLGCFLVWGSSIYFLQEKATLLSRITIQERRFNELLQLAATYKRLSLPLAGEDMSAFEGKDPVEIISSTLDQVGLKSNLVQLSVLSSGVNVQLEDLYGEDMGTFIQQIRLNGLEIMSAEIKTLPQGEGLLFSLSMIVGKRL